jgi:hypothetical protein
MISYCDPDSVLTVEDIFGPQLTRALSSNKLPITIPEEDKGLILDNIIKEESMKLFAKDEKAQMENKENIEIIRSFSLIIQVKI